MKENRRSLDNLRLEYSEANNNRRHYSNLRFAVLSVSFAVLGGVASVAFGIVEMKSPPGINVGRWARIAGLVFTVVFFVFEILCELNLTYFSRVAKRLEHRLGYVQFRARHIRFPRACWFIWNMYIALIAFWVYLLIRGA